MQVAHRLRDVAFLNHETDVDFRGSLRNHSYIHLCGSHRLKHAGRDARLAMNIFADQANDGVLILAGHVRNSFQIGDERRGQAFRLHGEGHAHFGNRHQIDRRGIAVQSLKHGPQEAMNHNTARSHHVHETDTSLRRDRTKCILSARGMGRDAGAFAVHVAGI